MASSYVISGPGVYSVTLTNACGSTEDEITIDVQDPPMPVDLGNDTILCPAIEVLLDPDPDLGDFLWQNGSTNDTYLVTAPGQYALTVSNMCGMVRDTIVVDYYPDQSRSSLMTR
jgi:hypothetical protein